MLNKYIKNLLIIAIISAGAGYTVYYAKINFENYISWQKEEYSNINQAYTKTYEALEKSYNKKIINLKNEIGLLSDKIKEKQDFDPALQQMRFLQGNLQTIKYLISYSGDLNKAELLLQDQIMYINPLKERINIGVLFNLAKDELRLASKDYKNQQEKIYVLIERIKKLPIKIATESESLAKEKSLFKYYDVSKNSFFTKTQARIFVNQIEILQNQILTVIRFNNVNVINEIKLFLVDTINTYAPSQNKKELTDEINSIIENKIYTPNLDKLLLKLDNEIINYANA